MRLLILLVFLLANSYGRTQIEDAYRLIPSERRISKSILRNTDLVTGYFHFPQETIDYAIYMKDGKYGLIQDGSFLTKPMAYNIELMGHNKLVLNYVDSTRSLIVFQNKQIEVPQCTQMILEFFDGKFALLYNYKSGIIVMNLESQQIIDSGYYDYSIYEQGFIKVTSFNAWRVIDTVGQEVVQWRERKNKKPDETLIRISGCDFVTVQAKVLKDTALFFYSDERLDIISFLGDTLVENCRTGFPDFENEVFYQERRKWYKWVDGGVYFINGNGDTSQTFKSCYPRWKYYPYVAVYNELHKEGLFNVETMKYVLSPEFYYLDIGQEYVVVSARQTKGLYSLKDDVFFLDTIYSKIQIRGEIIAFKEDSLFIFNDNQLLFTMNNVKTFSGYWKYNVIEFYNGKIGLYDEIGKEIIPPEYDDIVVLFTFSENDFFALKMKGEWIIRNQKGKTFGNQKFTGVKPNRWFNMLEIGNYFREIYFMDDFGRTYETNFTRSLPDP